MLHGGLGNQLFQWAYGHQLAEQNSRIEMCFPRKLYDLEHAMHFLGDFLTNCGHLKFSQMELPRSKVIRAFRDPSNSRYVFQNSNYFLHNTSLNPFLKYQDPPKGTSKYQLGYYQNWMNVYPLRNDLKSELWSALNRRNRTLHEIDLEGAEVIHIRQGDTTTEKNLQSIGVLDSNYYKSLIKSTNRTRIAVTDDIEGARRILRGLPVDTIFGPKDFDVYQTLGIMARSSLLITANSTLSWWGGFLSSDAGGKVIIPNPFFRNLPKPPLEAFNYPGFGIHQSSFIESFSGR